jgi:hypothetical protein
MLDAFVQKNVRRVLSRKQDEHTYEKPEDAITSMVFNPAAVHVPDKPLACFPFLSARFVRGASAPGKQTAQNIAFGLAGRRRRDGTTEAQTRAAPELLASFTLRAIRPEVYTPAYWSEK